MTMKLFFIDNYSTDGTQDLLEEMCKNDAHIKTIFNAKNFGHIRSPYYGLLQTSRGLYNIIVCGFSGSTRINSQFVKSGKMDIRLSSALKQTVKKISLCMPSVRLITN